MTPTIFLDFDGVLNNAAFNAACQERGIPCDEWIDPAAVLLLNKITDRTGARLVVSSCWRIGHTLNWLRKRLAKHGVTGYVAGKTHEIPGGDRSQEIARWLQRHPCERYAILDDLPIGDHPVASRLVKTSSLYGLRRGDVERVVGMMGERE
jgi:hypothetical protein